MPATFTRRTTAVKSWKRRIEGIGSEEALLMATVLRRTPPCLRSSRPEWRMQDTILMRREIMLIRCLWMTYRPWGSISSKGLKTRYTCKKRCRQSLTRRENSSWKMLRKAKTIQTISKTGLNSFKMKLKKSDTIVPKYGQMNKLAYCVKKRSSPLNILSRSRKVLYQVSMYEIDLKAMLLWRKKSKMRCWSLRI